MRRKEDGCRRPVCTGQRVDYEVIIDDAGEHDDRYAPHWSTIYRVGGEPTTAAMSAAAVMRTDTGL